MLQSLLFHYPPLKNSNADNEVGGKKYKLNKQLLVKILEKLKIPRKLELSLMHLVVGKDANKGAEGQRNC